MKIESNLSFLLHRKKNTQNMNIKISLLKKFSHKIHNLDTNSSSILYNGMLKLAMLYDITLLKN